MGDLDALAISYAAVSDENIDTLNAELTQNINEADELLKYLKTVGPADKQYCSETSAAPETEKFITLSDEFHLIFYKYCKNNRLARSAERMRSQMSIAAYQYEKNTENLIAIHEEHVQIYKAFISSAYAEASALMKTHMEHSLQYALKPLNSH